MDSETSDPARGSVEVLQGNGVSDVHLCGSEGQSQEAVIYPGPRRPRPEEEPACELLLQRCRAIDKDEFLFSLGQQHFRGRRDRLNVERLWYRLRLIPPQVPLLDALPSPLPPSVIATLTSERLRRGGLVWILGAGGAGKTTTGYAVLVSRLCKFGGLAFTLEDDCEMPVDGWHGENGICHQGQVSMSDREESWEAAFRGILRSQPAGSTPMLFVGEIRSGVAARYCIRAAQNGFLVIATAFGTDIPTGIKSLVLAAADYSDAGVASVYESLAPVLKLVVYQQLRVGAVSAQILAVGGDSAAMAMIRHGQLEGLRGPIGHQENVMFTRGNDAVDLLQVR
jgi:Tfp pilus assembly pilus retraction ATPase PilT